MRAELYGCPIRVRTKSVELTKSIYYHRVHVCWPVIRDTFTCIYIVQTLTFQALDSTKGQLSKRLSFWSVFFLACHGLTCNNHLPIFSFKAKKNKWNKKLSLRNGLVNHCVCYQLKEKRGGLENLLSCHFYFIFFYKFEWEITWFLLNLLHRESCHYS